MTGWVWSSVRSWVSIHSSFKGAHHWRCVCSNLQWTAYIPSGGESVNIPSAWLTLPEHHCLVLSARFFIWKIFIKNGFRFFFSSLVFKLFLCKYILYYILLYILLYTFHTCTYKSYLFAECERIYNWFVGLFGFPSTGETYSDLNIVFNEYVSVEVPQQR